MGFDRSMVLIWIADVYGHLTRMDEMSAGDG
jgi:hypothetical protein